MRKIEQLIPFKIKHIDSLGQGVSHHNDQVSFIPKTLPGESGEAIVTKKSKKVQFAKINSLVEKSSNRIEPKCPHFNECQGCSFLHTSYENELNLKIEAAKHQFKRFSEVVSTSSFPAETRFNYRNRIQLHYDKKKNLLGYIGSRNHDILEVPGCLLPKKSIQSELKKLYENNSWQKLVLPEKNKGHIELREIAGSPKVFLNREYAAGGFSQVNDSGNKKVLEQLETILEELKPSTVIDLFGGNGNLTSNMTNLKSWIVDTYHKVPNSHQDRVFINQNIYHKNAFEQLSRQIPEKTDLLILDPPRRGLKNLDEFLNYFEIKHIIYISCFYPNMIRDLLKIKDNYQLNTIQFHDFFPGTHHLEVLTLLSRK